MMRAFPDMVGAASPNLPPSDHQNRTNDMPVSPIPMFGTNTEGMASIGLTPFTSGSEAATLPQVRQAREVLYCKADR